MRTVLLAGEKQVDAAVCQDKKVFVQRLFRTCHERVKNFGMGITDFALACGSEPVVDVVYSAVIGSIRSGHVLDTDREDLKR